MPDAPEPSLPDADDSPREDPDRDEQERERTGDCGEQEDALVNNTLALP